MLKSLGEIVKSHPRNIKRESLKISQHEFFFSIFQKYFKVHPNLRADNPIQIHVREVTNQQLAQFMSLAHICADIQTQVSIVYQITFFFTLPTPVEISLNKELH
jgi:hypothetical protein